MSAKLRGQISGALFAADAHSNLFPQTGLQSLLHAVSQLSPGEAKIHVLAHTAAKPGVNWQKTHITARSRATPCVGGRGGGASGGASLAHGIDGGWLLESPSRRRCGHHAERGGKGNAANESQADVPGS